MELVARYLREHDRESRYPASWIRSPGLLNPIIAGETRPMHDALFSQGVHLPCSITDRMGHAQIRWSYDPNISYGGLQEVAT